MKKTILTTILLSLLVVSPAKAGAWNDLFNNSSLWIGNRTSAIAEFLGLTDTPSSYSGESGNCTAVNAGETALEFVSCGGGSSPLTTKGDVWGYSSADARIPVGANGEVLTADSTQSLGLKWSAIAGSGDVTAGANLGDNLLIRGDGAGKGIQNSGITIDDSDNITGVVGLTATTFTGSGSGLTSISADDVDITDAGSYYTGTEVETALQEIGAGTTLDNLYLDRSAWNGTFKESFDAVVTSNGTVVTMSLEKAGTGDLTMQFSDAITILDCTPAKTIALTVGTVASPQANYIYILQTDPSTLVKSTTQWPSAEHIKVGYFLVQTAVYVQSDGVLINQNWNDGLSDGNSTGHITHIGQWIRAQGANWFSGVDGAGTDDYITTYAGGGYIKVNSGVIMQMHKHNFTAKDTQTGDDAHVWNYPSASYTAITDLNDMLLDSTGGSLTNRYYNIILVGIANKGGEYSPLLITLPAGSYNSSSNAINDVDDLDDYSLPREFTKDSSTGFLIARITLRNQGDTTFTVMNTQDLRGLRDVASGGSLGGTPQTTFSDNQFNIYNNTDTTKIMNFDISGVTTGNTRIITAPDVDTKMWADNGSVPLTANWDVGAYTLTGTRFISDIATGTAPFGVSSTTKVANLNCDQTDGFSMDQTITSGATPTFTGTNFTGIPSILVTDTTDTTSFVALWESATGELLPQSDGGLTYNAGTANLATTTFTGALSGNATTATSLFANGANCSAGNYPLGVDASGAVESCTADNDTTYTAGGTLLDLTGTTFSINEGTLTDTKGCIYTTASGLVCNSTFLTANETITISGDTSGSGTTAITTTIGNDKVLEPMLKAVDAPADEECLTYEVTTGDFEWQTCGGGSGASTALDNLASVAINLPLISDTYNTDALGSSAIGWSDLFLGTGAVIDWTTSASTSDMTLTHSSNLLTFAGGTVALGTATATGGLTGNITGDVTGNAGTVSTITGLAPDTATTQASQPNITSLGTLTSLDVDNININLNTISSTAGTDLFITPLAGQQLILDGTIVIDAGVITNASSITSTSFIGALTGNADTVTTNANLTGEVTSVGNAATIADSIAVSNWNLTTPTITTQLTLTPVATPTTDADGEIAIDIDGWGTGYDAIEYFNGTASAYVVATTASDAPTNGQVPKWNTGGTITWEDDSTGSGSLGSNLTSSTNDILSDTGTLLWGGTGNTNNENLTWDFETTANIVAIGTSTGLTGIDFASINADFDSSTVTLSTILGAIDSGGATSFEIPNGASPTVDAVGEIAIDTTSDQYIYYGGSKRVMTYQKEICFALEDPVDADDNIAIYFPRKAILITDVYCQVDGGTSIAMVISDGTNALESITCDADGAEDDGSITNGAFTALERMEFDLDAASGTNTLLNGCITYTITAD